MSEEANKNPSATNIVINPGPGGAPANNPAPSDPEPSPPKKTYSDEEQQEYIKKLREENKARREEAEKLKKEKEDYEHHMQLQQEAQAFGNSIVAIAKENEIGQDGTEYLAFLIEQAVSGLDENEELSEDALEALIAKAKAVGVTTPANSTVKGGGGPVDKTSENKKASDGPTYAEFKAMNLFDKQKLYESNRAAYLALFEEQKTRGDLPEFFGS